MHLVSAWVLLKVNLYCGKRFLMYLVDLIAMSLVFWIAIMARFVCWICLVSWIVLCLVRMHSMILLECY